MEKEIKSTGVLLVSGGETPNGGRQVKNKQDAERTQRTENKNPLRSASFIISENKKKKI